MTPIDVAADGTPVSTLVGCAGLVSKTVEIKGAAAQLGQSPVILEGTVSEGANDKAGWFALTGNITGPGLVTIALGTTAPQALFYEPELTYLRIRAPGGTMPSSISAVMAAVWGGGGVCWADRIKQNGLGYPPQAEYKAV